MHVDYINRGLAPRRS